MKMTRRLLSVVLFFALSGCAVLTIDVDVYKGPLINSDRMKVEQILAMSIAAKPLLQQLRSVFEEDCKEPERPARGPLRTRDGDELDGSKGCVVIKEPKGGCPDIHTAQEAVEARCLESWEARRVNAILSLYSEVGGSAACLKGFGPAIVNMQGSLAALRDRIFVQGKSFSAAATAGRSDLTRDQEYAALQTAMLQKVRDQKEVTDAARKLLIRLEERSKKPVAGEKLLQNAAELRETRQAFVHFYLSDPESMRILGQMRQDVRRAWEMAVDALRNREKVYEACAEPQVAVAWLADFASKVSDPFELAEYLTSAENKRKVPVLAEFATGKMALSSVPDLTTAARDAAQTDLKSALLSARGSQVAAELLRIHEELRSSAYRDAIPAGLATQHAPGELQKQAGELRQRLGEIATGFEGGRRNKGISALAREYMEINTLQGREIEEVSGRNFTGPEQERLSAQLKINDKAKSEVKGQVQAELLDLLVDFGEKVSHMANLQPLLPTNQDQKGKRIQLLQAIGNTILNQIDDLLKRNAYRNKVGDPKQIEAELAGLKSARNSMAGSIVAELVLDVTKAPKDTPRKEGIVGALVQGDAKLREAQKLIQDNLNESSKEVVDQKARQDSWGSGKKAFGDGELEQQLKKDLATAKTDAAFTTAARKTLVGHLDKRTKEEKGKDKSSRLKEYIAARDAYDKLLSKEVEFKVGTSEVNVIKSWLARIDKAIEQSAADEKKAAERSATMKNWLGRVESAVTATVRGPEPRAKDSYKTTLDVFDDVLRELEYSRVMATRAGLAGAIEQIDFAIAYARKRRAEMQYITPASLFLRDSYPATVLQESPAKSGSVPNLIWRKLRNAFREEEASEDLAVKEQVDKQFWQTVNQIRLGGGGTTNYVVAKDDLGNWYVKGYENDLDSIVNSVRGLALFAAGGKVGANLLKPQAKPGTGPGTNVPVAFERTPFERQMDSSTKNYRGDLLKVVVEAREKVSGLQDSFEKEFGKVQLTDKGRTHLDGKRAEFIVKLEELSPKIVTDSTGDDGKDAAKLNEELRALLEGALGYYKLVNSKLGGVVEADKKAAPRQTSDEDIKTVTRSLWQYTRNLVDRHVGNADKAGARLESRVGMIGELLDATVSDGAAAK